MSTKKEKCRCYKFHNHDHGVKKFCDSCTCQSESIEWEKDLSFRFDTWLKLYPGTPTIGEIEEWWLESLRISITTAVAKRDGYLVEEVEKISLRKEVMHDHKYIVEKTGKEIKAEVLSILKH